MPYIEQFIDPEIACEHNGRTIYYTYRDDMADQGRNEMWFTTSILDCDEGWHFDVRDFDTGKLLDQHPPFLTIDNYPDREDSPGYAEAKAAWDEWHKTGEPAAIQAILKAAIEAQLLEFPNKERAASNPADANPNHQQEANQPAQSVG